MPSTGSGPEQALRKCLLMNKLTMKDPATVLPVTQANRLSASLTSSLTHHIIFTSKSCSKIFFFFNNFIYLCIFAVLGLCWCMGFSLVAVQGLLTAMFSPALEHRLDSMQAQ